MADKPQNIYQKLIEVRKSVVYLRKEKEGAQYSYVGSSQVLGSLKAKMDEVGLLLIPKILSKEVTGDTVEWIEEGYKGVKKPKRTTTYFTELFMEYTWVNAENPAETIVCPWYGQGVDIAGEKGVGKALTYSEKYFLLKFFNIPTDKDDPDAFQQKFDEEKPVLKSPQKPQKASQKAELSPEVQKAIADLQKAATTHKVAFPDVKKMAEENFNISVLTELSVEQLSELTKIIGG